VTDPVTSLSVRRARRLWIGYWLLLFALTHVPISRASAARVKHADKAVHFVLFFGLTWLGARAVARRPTGSLPIGTLTAWAAVYLLYAAADEWLQGFVRRTPNVLDWIADASGVVLATVWWGVRELKRTRNRNTSVESVR